MTLWKARRAFSPESASNCPRREVLTMAHLSDAQHAAIADLIPELDRVAVDAMADWRVPGAAIVVVQDGKIALTKAYGQRDVETDRPVTAATQFVMCSITKS